jgi:GT2 family glycosyltransferase
VVSNCIISEELKGTCDNEHRNPNMTKMTALPKVAIITLCWRNYKDTIECLESLLKLDYPCFQIFVVDNGSHDGSAERIEEWGSRFGSDFCSVQAGNAEQLSFKQSVILLKSGENLGYTGGNNLASRIALKTQIQYIWYINNDTVQDSKALLALVETAQTSEKAGMVCSKVFYFSKTDVIESMGATLIVPFGIFRHIGQGTKNYTLSSRSLEIRYIYACSFLVDVKLIAEVGLLDERYFLIREESDWSIRARQKGWKLYVAPDSRVWHKVSMSVKKRSELFFYYVTRNTLLFMREHHPVFLPFTVISMLFLVSGLIFIDNFLDNKRGLMAKIKMMALGYIHFFNRRFGKVI